jgi:anti-sigma factor RsiW
MKDCHDIEPRLSEFVDGTLEPDEQQTVSAHVGRCPRCQHLAADLARLRDAARHLGPVTPPAHIWLEVAGQVRLDQPHPAPAPRRTGATWQQAGRQWLGLAAALVFVTLGVWLVQRAPATLGGEPAPELSSADVVASELELALQHYERAIAALEVMAAGGDDTLDPVLAGTLRSNKSVLDRAIAESRQALADDPGSAPARDSLFEALRQKVGLLQSTVTLINEMRKGNPEGAVAATGRGRSS